MTASKGTAFTTLVLFVLDLVFLLFFYKIISKCIVSSVYLQNIPGGRKIVFGIVILISLIYEKIYTIRYDFWEETKHILKSLFYSFLIVYAILITENGEYGKYGFIIYYFLGLSLFFPVYKRLIKRFIFFIPFFREKVKIVGDKIQANILKKEFDKNWYLGFEVVDKSADTIFVASKNMSLKKINSIIKRYSKHIKNIYVIPYVESINFSQSKILEFFNIRLSVVKIENNLLKIENIIFKEAMDKIFTILLLPFFILFHIVISYLIKRDSKGEVIFVQDRVGKDNKPFKCYKYRSMYENSDRILKEYLKENPEEVEYYKKYHKYKNDPRITRVGKFLRLSSLDELPQIINILKGEMNLIGPRPYMPEEINDLKSDFELITRVKPGISGLWQVSGRNNLSFSDRIKIDAWYIQNWSLWVDMVIFVKTIKIVLLKTGAK